jgi:hypothetical protein
MQVLDERSNDQCASSTFTETSKFYASNPLWNEFNQGVGIDLYDEYRAKGAERDGREWVLPASSKATHRTRCASRSETSAFDLRRGRQRIPIPLRHHVLLQWCGSVPGIRELVPPSNCLRGAPVNWHANPACSDPRGVGAFRFDRPIPELTFSSFDSNWRFGYGTRSRISAMEPPTITWKSQHLLRRCSQRSAKDSIATNGVHLGEGSTRGESSARLRNLIPRKVLLTSI